MQTQATDPVVTTQNLTPPGGVRANLTPHPRLMNPAGVLSPAGSFHDQLYSRLEWTAITFATAYTVVYSVGRFAGVYQSMPGYNETLSRIVLSFVLMASALLYAASRKQWLAPERMENAGLTFEVAAAFAIDVFLVWLPQGGNIEALRISWVAVWIMFYVIVVPAPPRKQLVAAVLAATSTPVLLAIGIWRGVSDPSSAWILQYVFPNYVAVACSFLGAKIVYRMREQVREARALGSYRLVERLGHGGMGEVWRAEHSRLARPAAIKLIRPEVMERQSGTPQSSILRRFEREAQITATLESAHTVTLYDFGINEEGAFYYVMELLRGLDLELLVKRFGPLPPARVAFLLRQVCHSLDEAHSRALIHRDIKPANLYLCQSGKDFDFVKVLDFGLARPVYSGPEAGLTMAGLAAGTPAYMAPELILATQPADARADIYSLGCVGYYLLTGRLVFDAPTAMAVALQHLHAPPPAASEICETPVPDELNRLLLACLAKDPALRPQSMAEITAQLDQLDPAGWTAEDARHWWLLHLPERLAATAGKPQGITASS